MKQKFAFSLTTLPGILAALTIYGFAHSAMRLTASWNLGENDPVSVLNAQTFLTWMQSGGAVFDLLVFALLEVLGPSALVFQILRYGFLAIALFIVFLIALRVTQSGFWAALTVESYALIYQISWRFHEGFTYPMVTIIAVAGSYWAYLRFEEHKERWILVAFVTFGMFTGFWYFVFLMSFALALFIQGGSDRHVGTLLTLPLVTILLLSFTPLLPSWHGSLVHHAAPLSFISGGTSAGLKVIAYLSPFVPIVLLLFGKSLWQRRQSIPRGGVIASATVIGALGVVLGGMLTGQAAYGEHALMPLFFLTPIWIMDCVRRAVPSPVQIKLYAGLCLILMVVAFGGRAANLYILDPVCKRCYFGIPYQGLAQTLAAEFELDSKATVIAADPRISGHLFVFWPYFEKPLFLTKEPEPGGEALLETGVLFVWDDQRGSSQAEKIMRRVGIDDEAIDSIIANAHIVEVPWPHLWRQTGYRTSRWQALWVQKNAAVMKSSPPTENTLGKRNGKSER